MTQNVKVLQARNMDMVHPEISTWADVFYQMREIIVAIWIHSIESDKPNLEELMTLT